VKPGNLSPLPIPASTRRPVICIPGALRAFVSFNTRHLRRARQKGKIYG